MSKANKIFFYPSSLVLVLVNLIPLLGVLFLGWDVFSIIILYWMESAVIGFFNILKMQKINNYKFTPLLPFFIMHYAIFMFVHLSFIINFFQPNLQPASDQLEALVIIWQYFRSIFIYLFLIFLSHGLSFIYNFIKREEFKHISIKQQMFIPYRRIIIMHLVIMLAGAGIIYLEYDKAVSAIVFLVILKIIFDLGSHIFEHRKNILN